MTEVLARPRALERERRAPAALEASSAHPLEEVPSWRGVLHEKAFALAPALGLLLVWTAESPRAVTAAAVFALTMTAMLGVSAMNHRGRYAEQWRPWFRRADHAAIHTFLAGTWCAVAIVLLSGTSRVLLMALVTGAAVVASLVTFLHIDVPGWIPASIAVAVGWLAAAAFVGPAQTVAPAGVALFLAGGLVYTAGAVVYALRRPEPHPAFGYHELFHLLVLVGVACHYLAVALYVLPVAG